MDTPDPFPAFGRLIGIDYGTKRIGVAVSDIEQRFAGALSIVAMSSEDAVVREFSSIVDDNSAVGFVVGLPVHMSGDEGGKAVEAREFGDWLHSFTGLPVCYYDERFTTQRAESHLIDAQLSKKKRKARLDALAAQFMLQAFLDTADRTAPPGAM